MIKATTPLLLFLSLAMLLTGVLTGCKKKGPCDTLVCQNGGYCSGDTCVCKPGYYGALCENFNACDTIKCLNGGACANGACLCANGFYGTRCDSPIRDLYIGSYKGTLTLSSQGTGIPSTATVSADTSLTGVNISLDGTSMDAILSAGGSFNVPNQGVSIGGFSIGTISGSGSFAGNTLNLSFGENIQITTINGVFVGTKQ